MSRYVENFVTGHHITFETNKRNKEPFEKSLLQWNQIRSHLEINSESIIIFCGAKNNGKSALVRNLINRYLHHEKIQDGENGDIDIVDIDNDDDIQDDDAGAELVYYVDFDPGQPEMTTPGVVSSHLISKTDVKLQSPTYLNVGQHKTLMMSSVGGINMSVNPRNYIENCRKVFEAVKHHQRETNGKQPIFVNTMGFIRNVGLAMLMDLIKLIRPTDLVILNVVGDPMRTIYADLTAPALTNTRASFYYETHEESRKKLNYRHHLYNLDFMFVDSSTIATKNRVALQLAYLSQMPEALYKPVMNITPRLLSFEDVSFYCVSSYPLKTEIVLELLHHSWVHLVRIRNNTSGVHNVQSENDQIGTSIKIIDDVGENEMLGCGIVTNIDLSARTLSIATPLSQNELKSKVNCVIKPLSVQVPREILQDAQ